MKYLLLISFLFIGCDNLNKICYPSPLKNKIDECHSKVEWNVICKENWKMVNCINRDDKGDGLTKIQYNKALKRCNVKTSVSYPIKDMK